MVREVTSVQQSMTCFAGPAPHQSDKSSSSCRLSAPTASQPVSEDGSGGQGENSWLAGPVVNSFLCSSQAWIMCSDQGICVPSCDSKFGFSKTPP